MEDAFTTLFQKPNKPAFKSSEESWKAKLLGLVLFPILVPALLIGAAISIPWTHIMRLKQRRDERRFAKQMEFAGRIMEWAELKSAIANGNGTVIGEFLSIKGPFRLWWTPDDIPTVSPHNWKREQHLAWSEPEFVPFFEWCYAIYTNPQSGLARLVLIPQGEQRQIKTIVTSTRFVSICSFPSLRETRGR